MAKAKAKSGGNVQNRSIYSRASYLYQAASYLASCAHEAAQGAAGSSHEQQQQQHQKRAHQLRSLSRCALADMRAVTLKAQIRQSQTLKRSVCKVCNSLLVEGRTCRSIIENDSKAGRKFWADVLAVRCVTCGTTRRFPVASPPRRARRALRSLPALPTLTTNVNTAPDATIVDQDVSSSDKNPVGDSGRGVVVT